MISSKLQLSILGEKLSAQYSLWLGNIYYPNIPSRFHPWALFFISERWYLLHPHCRYERQMSYLSYFLNHTYLLIVCCHLDYILPPRLELEGAHCCNHEAVGSSYIKIPKNNAHKKEKKKDQRITEKVIFCFYYKSFLQQGPYVSKKPQKSPSILSFYYNIPLVTVNIRKHKWTF